MSSTGIPIRTTIGEQALALANTALDLLFPPRCVSCRRVGTYLCSICVDAFLTVPQLACSICSNAISATFSHCKCEDRDLKSVHSAFLFDGTIRPAIHAFKYKNRKQLAEPLASGIATVLQGPIDPDSSLCAVPLHRNRYKERGFNQSELLANHLSHLWNLPLIPPDALIRTRSTAQQVGMSYAERQTNVGNAFSASSEAIAGRAILLIDDVCTTGATLSACASALMQADALSVRAVTLARAV